MISMGLFIFHSKSAILAIFTQKVRKSAFLRTFSPQNALFRPFRSKTLKTGMGQKCCSSQCFFRCFGSNFRKNAQNGRFLVFWAVFTTFGSKKVKMSSFFASGELLAPQTLQNGKVGPKVKKAVLGVLGSKNVPRTLRFSLFRARSENDAFSSFALFCAFALFGRKSSFWPPKVVKTSQNAKIPPFCAFLRKWHPKHLKKHWLEPHFWPMPVFSGLERKGRKSAFRGGKVRENALFRTFWVKITKIALFE